MPNDPLGLRGDPLGLRDKPVSAVPPPPLDLQPSRASIIPGEVIRRAKEQFIPRRPDFPTQPENGRPYVETVPPPDPSRALHRGAGAGLSEETARSILPYIPGAGGAFQAAGGVSRIARDPGDPKGYTELIRGGAMAALPVVAGPLATALRAAPLAAGLELAASVPVGLAGGEAASRIAGTLGAGPAGQELARTGGEFLGTGGLIAKAAQRGRRPALQALDLEPPPSPVTRQPGLEPPPEIPRAPEPLPEPSGAVPPARVAAPELEVPPSDLPSARAPEPGPEPFRLGPQAPEPIPAAVLGEPPRPLRTPQDAISPGMHKRIYALAKSDDALVHSTILDLTGKTSIKTLTRGEAQQVASALEGRPKIDLEPPPPEAPPIEAYERPSYERAPRGPEGPEIPPEGPPLAPPGEGPPLRPPAPRPPDPETQETVGLARLTLRRAFADNYQNIKKEGATGKEIQNRLEETQTATEVRSQGDHEDLIYPRGERKNGLLKISEEEKINLKDSIEGRAEPLNPRVAVLRENFNAISNRLADRAEELGVMVNDDGVWRPFQRRKGWVPHSFASPEELAKAGGIRKRIIQNMADNRGFTKERAESFIEEWIRFQTSKAKDYHPEQLITWLKDTRQAKSTAEALKLLDRFKARDVPRSGSLEYPRKLDLPLGDPDPSRAMLRSITKEWERLGWIEQFGQELPSEAAKRVKGPVPANQLDVLLKRASAEGADTGMIRNRLGHILRTKDYEDWKRTLSTRARLLNVSLLGQMAELNVFQGMLGTLIRGGPKATAYGLGKMFTKSGREFARRSGSMVRTEAAMALGEEMPATGSLAWAADKFLKVTGGSGTEMANRWTASNGGHIFTKDMLRWMQADPETIIGGMKVKHAKRQLERLGLDPNREPAMEEFYKAANRFDREVNFSSKEGHTPIIGSGPVGKMFWQFKNFIYNQSRLIWNESIRNLDPRMLRDDPIAFLKASRNLVILSTLYPFIGDRVRWWRSKKKGQAYMDRFEMETAVERYLEGATATGALGMGGEFYEAAAAGRMGSEILGPTLGGVAEVGERTIRGGPGAGAEALARRLPMGQPIVSRLKEPSQRRRRTRLKRYKRR